MYLLANCKQKWSVYVGLAMKGLPSSLIIKWGTVDAEPLSCKPTNDTLSNV